eukprot:m.20730 g.20730  ORF g.20730 m.20730 type:complete len:1265 (-) comp8198_c0_seq2:423-4217(-)
MPQPELDGLSPQQPQTSPLAQSQLQAQASPPVLGSLTPTQQEAVSTKLTEGDGFLTKLLQAQSSLARKRAPSRRERKVQQMLRQPDAHPVNLVVKLMFYVPTKPLSEDEMIAASMEEPDESLKGEPRLRAASRLADRVPDSAAPKDRQADSFGSGRASALGRTSAALHSSKMSAVSFNTMFSDGLDGAQPPATKATQNSSYIHYEFVAPHDDRACNSDMVIHTTNTKVFVDGEMRTGVFEQLNDDVMCGTWAHSYTVAATDDFVKRLYYEGLKISIWDTKDKVSTRARFDRPKASHAASKHAKVNVADHDEDGPVLQDGIKIGEGRKPSNCASSDGSGAVLNLDLRLLFAGDLRCTSSIIDVQSTGLRRLLRVKAVAVLDAPILSLEQEVLLNPLIIRLNRLVCMPNTPVSYEQLDEHCHNPYLTLKFFGSTQVEKFECPQGHGDTVECNQRLVVLTGPLVRADFAYWVNHTNNFTIAVHDRARRSVRSHAPPMIFGKEAGESEGIIAYNQQDAVGRALSNRVVEEGQLWDPFGIATVDMRPIIFGTKKLKLAVPILPCDDRDAAEFTASGEDAGHAMFPGHYIQAGSHLELTIEVMHARRFDKDVPIGEMLVRAGAVTEVELRKRMKKGGAMRAASPATSPKMERAGPVHEAKSRPFIRFVAVVNPDYLPWVTCCEGFVHDVNLSTLKINQMDTDKVSALSTFSLSESQIKDPDLDVITGIQISFPSQLILILEGPASGSLTRLMQEVQWPDQVKQSEFRTLFNTKILFSERVYAGFGIGLSRIHMNQDLPQLLQKQELYFQTHHLHRCLPGFTRLKTLSEVSSLEAAVRNEAFPSLLELKAIRRGFKGTYKPTSAGLFGVGEPFSPSTSTLSSRGGGGGAGGYAPSTSSPSGSSRAGRSGSRAKKTSHIESRTQSRAHKQSHPRRSPGQASLAPLGRTSSFSSTRRKAPLDMSTPYALRLQRQSKADARPTDFVQRNIQAVHSTSEHNATTRAKQEYFEFDPETEDGRPLHLYASQTQNATELGRERLRTALKSQRKDRVTYVFSEEYLHSSAFSLEDDPDTIAKRESQKSRQQWRTSRGFDSTKHLVTDLGATISRSGEPLRDGTQPVLDKGVFEDSLVNQAKLRFDRKPLPWSERRKEMVTATVPPADFGQSLAGSVFAPDEKAEREAKIEAHRRWEEALVVADPVFRPHHSRQTEQPSTAATDLVVGILKDPPTKATLKRYRVRQPRTSIALDTPYADESLGALTLSDHGTAKTGYLVK